MIIYPKEYMKIGQSIKLKEIEDRILKVVAHINCNYLSFSGGLDSSLMLYYMLLVYDKVYAFTMGESDSHPDVEYSVYFVSRLENVDHNIYIPSIFDLETAKQYPEDVDGDMAVRLFYKHVALYTDRIIACDGIDEFMCGYYAHQENPCERIYYKYLKQLSRNHLIPLHKNSGDVKVYLPYLDERLLFLLSQIPISEKVNKSCRKKLMVDLAEDKIPNRVINRRKYGFCDVLRVKI